MHLSFSNSTYSDTALANTWQLDNLDRSLMSASSLSLPGSVQFIAERFEASAEAEIDNKACISYIKSANEHTSDLLQLSFCIQGKVYCNESSKRCENCPIDSQGCAEEMKTVDLLQLQFSQKYLQQFLPTQNDNNNLLTSLNILNQKAGFEEHFSISGKLKSAINALVSHTYEGTMANIFVNAQLQMVLLYSLESQANKQEAPVFVCKFLANDDDRKKILAARDVLIKNINTPITIKQLSRKVGINECYLKKGFKEVFGSTIFEFYQTQRMEHAKYLLYEKGLTVTEVSELLNYSSISHFSTAFKKQTGIKPCELLNR